MYLKKLLFITALILPFSPDLYAQEEGFSLEIKGSSENREMRELMKFFDIERHEVLLHSKDLAGKKVKITYVEYKDGVAGKEHLLTKGLPDRYYSAGKDDTSFSFSVLTDEQDSTLLMQVAFPSFTMKFDNDKLGDKGYSLRSIDYNNGKYKYDSKVTLFTWALPYEVKNEGGNGYWSYCELTSDDVPPEQWHEKYGVTHYIIFYLSVNTKK